MYTFVSNFFLSNSCELNIGTESLLKKKTEQILEKFQVQKPGDLQQLFHVSEKIADLNYRRYQEWENQKEELVLHVYNGAAYQALKLIHLTTENWEHADEHIAILSGLYGVLRPTDRIRPYRLEMGTKTTGLIGETLYDFWGESVSTKLNQLVTESGAKYILNLASKEYSGIMRRIQISVPIIEVDFKCQTEDGMRTITIHVKQVRGKMARFILDNQIKEHEELKKFSFNGYFYSDELSIDTHFVFLKKEFLL